MITGCLIERGGKYTVMLNLYVDGKRKQKSIATGLPIKGNKRRAEELLKQCKLEYSTPEGGKSRGDKSPLFADFMQDWLERTKRSIERTTYQSYKNMTDAHIDKHFRTRCRACGFYPNSLMISKAGSNCRQLSVRAYSTWGGIRQNSTRRTRPFSSSP